MVNKRVLDLAKDLGVTAEDVQRAASNCGVMASGPSSSLDSSDVTKVTAALKEKQSKSGSKTLTLGKTLSLGGGRSSSDTSRDTVAVTKRRRRGRVVSPSVVKPTVSPAEQAKAAVNKPTVAPAEQAKAALNKPTVSPAEKAKAAINKPAVAPAEQAKAAINKPTVSPAEKAKVAVNKPTVSPAEKAKAAVNKPTVAPAEKAKVAVNKPTVAPAEKAKVAVNKPTVAPAEKAKVAVNKPTVSPAEKAKSAVNKPTVAPAEKAKAAVNKPAVKSKTAYNKPAVKVTVQKTVAGKPLVKSSLTPAQMAAKKIEASKVKKEAEQLKQRQVRQARRSTYVQHTVKQPRRHGSDHKNESLPSRTSRASPHNRPVRPKQGSGGPRTTIRTGLTPAQIAARKAPRSSIKQIEEKITKERRQQRQNRPQGQRPNNRSTGNTIGAGVRRPASVTVAPSEQVAAPTGQKRRGPQPGQRFQKRRLTPAEKAARRDYSSKRHASLTPEQEERMARLAKGGRRGKDTVTKDDEAFVIREVEILDGMIVSDLAAKMAVKAVDLVKKLFDMGQMITINDSLEADTAMLIVEEFGHKPKLINEAAVEDVLIAEVEADEGVLSPRPPVVVVMGHVDHGKTSILDALRKATVAEGEAGGITQHIGAYMVKLDTGERVVFVDTPGHEAFTGLRARGAKLTDVAVLVVAADDGVMPQTVEALNHARSAGVPIIVAVNKMDKEGADPEMVKRQLAEHDVVPEDWGGDTIFVNVSAHTGEGLEDLLEMLALQTDILELRANPDRTGRGVVIESRLDKGRGPVATVLVQNGTFKKGDTVVVGSVMGKIRAIVDENAVQHKTAGPSTPFELIGLKEVPEAGLEIVAVENDRQAKDIVSYRKEKARQQGVSSDKRATLDELFADMESGIAEVPVLIKGDVTGSVEAMAESLVKAGTNEVKVKVIHKGIGGITESDIMLASASNAIVIGFNVRPETKAKKLAVNEGVDVRFYKVIYDAIDEVKLAMAGKLSPDKVEKVTGSAEVREVFIAPKIGAIAGSYVTDGFVKRGSKVRVLRDAVMIHDGTLASLRRFRDDVKEVKTGYECGIGVEGFNDVKEGDTFEFYVIEEVAATL
ncbi:MAG: translation initiation factor IF-2 [Ghiorsea sp.]|nr:translation initiation factor IF-2 [Ghiorsea sp.]